MLAKTTPHFDKGRCSVDGKSKRRSSGKREQGEGVWEGRYGFPLKIPWLGLATAFESIPSQVSQHVLCEDLLQVGQKEVLLPTSKAARRTECGNLPIKNAQHYPLTRLRHISIA